MQRIRKQSKTVSLMAHTQIRMVQRYGHWLEKRTIKELAEMCRLGRFYCHLGRRSLTRSKIVVKYREDLIPLIYDKKRHCIVTVLTLEMLSAREKALVEAAGNTPAPSMAS